MAGLIQALVAGLAACAAVDASAQQAPHRNATAGGLLRPGVYGHIEVAGDAPPPVIYRQPLVAAKGVVHAGTRPLYLYVPPGHVRKWERFCAKWSACDQPVLFVRMDDSPGRWGNWRHFRAEDAGPDRGAH
ncbi:MAG: hypothetical protein EOO24_22775 [Comamonadaceae bacterium]|nr:MAG: hypothetical protein EOO24_22775 [Comamonadaceae bacterium]